MKKFLLKVICLVFFVSILIYGYWKFSTKVATYYHGLSTEQQIRLSFRNAIKNDYNCYLLGNSRIYRDLNPDKLNNVYAFNFGHDNDNNNQMYYKLLYLLDNGKKIDILIIGTDYFQFSYISDSRNYVYSKLFRDEYNNDYESTEWERFLSEWLTQWSAKRLLWSDIKNYIKRVEPSATLPYQRDNGQWIVEGVASLNDTVERDHEILDIQYDYYKRIVEVCEQNNIELYVIMPPARDEELASYTQEEMEYIDEKITEGLGERYTGNYYNCSRLPGLTHYTNYIDITHLNEEAADRFSQYVNDKILKDF